MTCKDSFQQVFACSFVNEVSIVLTQFCKLHCVITPPFQVPPWITSFGQCQTLLFFLRMSYIVCENPFSLPQYLDGQFTAFLLLVVYWFWFAVCAFASNAAVRKEKGSVRRRTTRSSWWTWMENQELWWATAPPRVKCWTLNDFSMSEVKET